MNKQMSSTKGISTSLAKAQRAQCRMKEAWATWRQSAGDAHFAAVMGFALPRNLHPGAEWNVSESIAADSDLQNQIAASSLDDNHADALRKTIQGHIEWVLGEIEKGVITDAQSVFPGTTTLTLNDPQPAIEASKAAMEAVTRSVSKLEARLTQAQAELERFESEVETRGLSMARKRAIQLHTEQSDFVLRKAQGLSFCDEALHEVTLRIAKGKEKWKGSASAFFTSKRYTGLINERKSIKAERAHVELELQSYFDHHAHGASHSESVKPDRQSLKIAPDLEKASAGFKQVQLIDMYCLSRGNEM